MTVAVWISAAALLITFSTLLASALYRVGHHAARLEALETWRGNLRVDMHEISNQLSDVYKEVHQLRTLLEERTERRSERRP